MQISKLCLTLKASLFVGLLSLMVLANPMAARAELPELSVMGGEKMLGDENAPVTMIEYSSLTCPHCAAFHKDTLPSLIKKYVETGKVKIIYRDFPFDRPGAQGAMLARCVAPDHYFKMLGILFDQQEKWTRTQNPAEALRAYGKLVGMSDADFEACLANQQLLDAILARRVEGMQKHTIQATPSFIINGEKIEGAAPLSDFEDLIDGLLEK